MLGRFSNKSLGSDILPGLTILVILIAGFWPQWAALAQLWTNSLVWTHGWLIATVSLWLMYTANSAPLALQPPSLKRMIPLLLALCVFVFAQFAYIDLAQQGLLPVLGLSIAYALFGIPGVRRFGFPIFYILFAIPVWDVLVPTLQTITVKVNQLWLWAAGVPVSIAGDNISVPAGEFVVEGGCSGSHFFVVALAVSSLHSRLWKMSRKMTVSAVLFATALALLANWVRVYVIIMRAIATQMQTSLIKDHYWFGWFLFAGALLVYFLTMRYFDKGLEATSPASATVVTPARPFEWVRALAPAGLLLILTNVHAEWFRLNWAELPKSVRSAPNFTGTWSGPLLQDTDWKPSFNGADHEVLATYHNTEGLVSWYRAIYREQHSGSKLIGYGNSLVPEGWIVRSEKELRKSKDTDYTSTQAQVLITTARSEQGQVWRIWSWYIVDGHKVAQPWAARLWLGLQGFTLNKPTQAGIVALAAECRPDCERADSQLQLFFARLDGDHK